MEEKKLLTYPNLRAEMVRNSENFSTLATILEISEASVRRRFNGEVEWTIGEIKTLSAHYGKTTDELFY